MRTLSLASPPSALDESAHTGMVMVLSIIGGFVGTSCIAGGALLAWNKYRKRGVLPGEEMY